MKAVKKKTQVFFPPFVNEISILLDLSICSRVIFCCCFPPVFTLFCSFISFGDETGQGKDELCASVPFEVTKYESCTVPH